MSSAISVLRKRWLVLAAVVVLIAVVLTAGNLFAANERQQPESSIVAQQSVTDATAPGRTADLPVAPPAPERVFAQPDDNDEEEIDLPPIVKVPPAYPNLDSNLNRLAEQAQAAGQENDNANSAGGGSSGSAPMPDPVLVTFYVEPEQVAALRQFLEDNDVFIRHAREDWIEALVPPALLPVASELPGVWRVDTVIPGQPAQSQGNTVSQGVALHRADAWHRMGYRGQGVKIGVIDTGFVGFRELQASGELPGRVVARCYFDPDEQRLPSSSLADCEVDDVHGTAVAETIIDVAPEVELYIANATRSFGDLRDAVDWMVSNEVDVINHSVGWSYQGPGDGTSPFGNSALNSVDAAVAGGIVWVNAAGNDAKNTWYGMFNDAGTILPAARGVHNYETEDIDVGNSFYVPFFPDESYLVWAFMRWEDSWGGADCNLDLRLFRSIPGPNNDVMVADDVRIQSGGADHFPFAILWFEVDDENDEGYYYLRIRKETCADDPAWIQLSTWMPDELQFYSSRHHIGTPGESSNLGMLAVGAVHWGSPYTIASYSSHGPTIDGRVKPDITGISCASSTVYPSRPRDGTECWFPGTSQASPHVAGLVALVRQRFPDYTPEQVTAYLKRHSDDHERGPLGADNTWGHGLAKLPVPGIVPERRGSPPTANLRIEPGDNDGEVDISWELVPEATHYRIGYVNVEVDYNLTQESCTKDWIEAFVYVDVNALNIPVNEEGRAEYTIRRLTPGAAHTFTVLTSNNLYDNKINVGAEFTWAELGKRWARLPGRNTLPPGIPIPQLDCTP